MSCPDCEPLAARVRELEGIVQGYETSCWKRLRRAGICAVLGVLLFTGCDSPRYGVSGIQLPTFNALPDSLTLYAPAEYDAFGAPTGPCLSAECGPRLWVHPNGATSLAGASVEIWYPPRPPAFGVYNPRATYRVRLNLRTMIEHGVTAGDVIQLVSFTVNDWSAEPFYGVMADTLPPLEVLAVRSTLTAEADSILSGPTTVVLRMGAYTDSAGTWCRLVHERFSRP